MTARQPWVFVLPGLPRGRGGRASERPRQGLGALLGLLALMLASQLCGAPFARFVDFTQPDGTRIKLWGEGDEFSAVFETQDGYTVIFDPAAKAYAYASLSADGNTLVATPLQVGAGDPLSLGLTTHLRLNPTAATALAAEKYALWDQGLEVSRRWAELKALRRTTSKLATDTGPALAPPSSTTTGSRVGLCLLIDFDDDPATVPRADIVDYCNGDAYTGYGNNGSVKKYFQDVSNNLLTYTNVVTIYIRIPNSLHAKSYYNDTSKNCGVQGNLLIRDAIAIMKALPNYASEILPTFSTLTVDGSNNILACNVFYAGTNGGAWNYGLWPHSWSLYSVGAQELSAGGKNVYRYQITDIGSSLALGTFCHENGHMLCGFPDLYDYTVPRDSAGGAGVFCLMGYGGYDYNPVQPCAYLKRAAGWATVTELTSASALTASLTASAGANFNHFYRYQKPGVTTEYYLFENRQNAGRDADLPAAGIAAWHIDELGDRDNQSMVPNSSHLNYECTLVQADNLWHFQNNTGYGDSQDLYYLGNAATAYTNQLTDSTSPAAHWWDGTLSALNAHDFSASADTMTFVIGVLDPGNPTDFAAVSASTSQINISWTRNPANNNVMVAWNTTASFGTPAAAPSSTTAAAQVSPTAA